MRLFLTLRLHMSPEGHPAEGAAAKDLPVLTVGNNALNHVDPRRGSLERASARVTAKTAPARFFL